MIDYGPDWYNKPDDPSAASSKPDPKPAPKLTLRQRLELPRELRDPHATVYKAIAADIVVILVLVLGNLFGFLPIWLTVLLTIFALWGSWIIQQVISGFYEDAYRRHKAQL